MKFSKRYLLQIFPSEFLINFIPMVMIALGVSVLHAALPTHWLPFVSVSRFNNWSRQKTFVVIAFAGVGHTLSTSLIGAMIVWLGIEVDSRIGEIFHYFSAVIIFTMGAYYIFRHISHPVRSECCGKKTHRMSILGLFLILTFSPCEAFFPVYLSAIKFGWLGFALLSAALAVGTTIGMITLTWIALNGVAKVKFESLERYDRLILGLSLWILAILGIIVE